jgi:hypothetical protein
MKNKKRFQSLTKKRSLVTFSIFFLIGIFLFFKFNFKAGSFEEQFFAKAEEQFGDKEKKNLMTDIYQSFLNDYIKIKLNRLGPNKYHIHIEFPKTDQPTELAEMNLNEKHYISLRFKPVDVQYIIALELKNETHIYVLIALNKEYTRAALKPFLPSYVKPRPSFSGSNPLNLVISILMSILLGVGANIVTPLFMKIWFGKSTKNTHIKAKSRKKPGKKKSENIRGG